MIVIIVDKNYREQGRYLGYMQNGVFHYKEGGIKLPLIGKIMTKDAKLKMDYDQSMDLSTGKTVFVMFDGKNYRQLFMDKEAKDNSMSTNDFIKDNENAFLAEQAMVAKPLNIQTVLNILLIIAVGLLMLSGFWGIGNAISNLNAVQKPFGQSINETMVLAQSNSNITRLCVTALHNLVNSSRKIQ